VARVGYLGVWMKACRKELNERVRTQGTSDHMIWGSLVRRHYKKITLTDASRSGFQLNGGQ
jgi:hypothetical protein